MLLDLCVASIRYGIKRSQAIPVDYKEFDPTLQLHRATFVTLLKNGNLRGCIGSLNARRPLIVDLAQNAFAAAFLDPRFPKIGVQEIDQLSIHISILSESEAIDFNSESDLLSQIRPGIDGLILEDKGNRSTFLPSVWESLPDPQIFLSQLKLKAGLHENHWSKQLKVSRYTTESISKT